MLSLQDPSVRITIYIRAGQHSVIIFDLLQLFLTFLKLTVDPRG